jgi:hypothetical protein
MSLALADDFKTINGKQHKDATVSRVEPDGIVLKTKSSPGASLLLSSHCFLIKKDSKRQDWISEEIGEDLCICYALPLCNRLSSLALRSHR